MGNANINLAVAETDTQVQKSLPWKLVTHQSPDTDAYLCLWIAARRLVGNDEYTVELVPAGENLPDDEAEGFNVVTMDTGRGELDQHEKKLERYSSFLLVCEKYGFVEDIALRPLIELSQATDNVEKIDYTSIHYVLKGLPHFYRNPQTGEVDWNEALSLAFGLFDILYSQARSREHAQRLFKKAGEVETLQNGLKFCLLLGEPRLRDAAFEAGADVVMWTHVKDRVNGRFYVGIQVNRASTLSLATAIEGIRIAEGGKRGVALAGLKLGAIGNNDAFGAWFLHDSENLIVSGSKTHEITDLEQFSKLTPQEIASICRKRLGNMRFNRVAAPAKKPQEA